MPSRSKPPSPPIDGDTHAHLIARCERFAAELGFDVERAPIEGGALGCCDHARRRIAVAVGLSANAEAHVLVHELAHAMGVGYRTHGRERAECIVECAAYLTLAAQGLDVEAASVPYLAGWAAEDGEVLERDAAEIDHIARRLEEALDRGEVAVEAA